MKPNRGDPGVRISVMTAALAVVFFLALGFWPLPQSRSPEAPAPAASDFRRHRDALERELAELRELLEALPQAEPERQKELMTFGVEFLRERVLAVMREEERTVYPEVERAVGATLHGRACFRYGHRVAEQWVQELEELALGCHPDAAEFRARAQDLILFLREHFEFEDRVVLPVLERRPVGPDLGAGLLCEP